MGAPTSAGVALRVNAFAAALEPLVLLGAGMKLFDQLKKFFDQLMFWFVYYFFLKSKFKPI